MPPDGSSRVPRDREAPRLASSLPDRRLRRRVTAHPPGEARIGTPPDDLYLDVDAPAAGDRPHVALSMVMAADGAVTVAGRTRRLGGEADGLAFQRLRERADAVLVGAETVRVESYGPVRVDEAARARRRQRGQPPVPPVAVVTTGRLDPAARLFGGQPRPLVVTPTGTDTDALEPVADIVRVRGGQRVDLTEALAVLAGRGVSWLTCEGGPRLNHGLMAAGLVDELFVTVAPTLVAGRTGLLEGGELEPPRSLELVEHHVLGGEVLLRYRVVGPAPDGA